ncbi:hypothetical protein BDM02DRAFT_3037166 [Thelephora ganbajun]|uniref:Uncharacterized protein n=1 Tax=Thelephora ganbajun TaxID=370292 RepID=A0ACB6ZA43_THEGA|nr:hypothetical protein BDM02DRAFT_3037166 [Thelephora ganbajun]
MTVLWWFIPPVPALRSPISRYISAIVSTGRGSRNVSVNRMVKRSLPVWGISYMLLPAHILFYLLPSQGTVRTPSALSGRSRHETRLPVPSYDEYTRPSLTGSHPLTEEREKRSFRTHRAIVQELPATTFLHHTRTACQGGYIMQNAWIRG